MEEKAPTKATKREMYIDYLSSEGYRPEVDKDGDIKFKKEGGTFYIYPVEDDPTFFHIIYPNFWTFKNGFDRVQVLEACQSANVRSKVTKIYIVAETMVASVEIFLPDPAEFKRILERAMSALLNGARNFAAKMDGKEI